MSDTALIDITTDGGQQQQQQQQVQDQGQGQGQQQQADGQGKAPRLFDYKGERIEVPDNFWDGEANAPNVGALLKAQADLRRQLSDKPKAPDAYEMVVPDTFKDKVKPNAEDPRWVKAQAWGKKHGLSQDAMTELLAVQFEADAANFGQDEEFSRAEAAKLEQALGANAADEKAKIGRWVGNLLGNEIRQDPELLGELNILASSAKGVLLLKTLMGKVGEKGIPSGRDMADAPLTEEALRKLQSDPDYATNPDKQRKVREGWARLYPG